MKWRPGGVANTEIESYPILATKAPGIPDFGHRFLRSTDGISHVCFRIGYEPRLSGIVRTESTASDVAWPVYAQRC